MNLNTCKSCCWQFIVIVNNVCSFLPQNALFFFAAEVDKKSKKMRDAEKFDVPVVSEDYLDAVKKGGAILMISQHSISSWGSKKVGFKTYKVCVCCVCVNLDLPQVFLMRCTAEKAVKRAGKPF